MKSKVIALTLLASTAITGYSNTAFAETCYTAGGTVNTVNVSQTQQVGEIRLILSDHNDTEFDKTGSLVGNITDADGFGTTILSHTASFSKGHGNIFVTSGDTAVLAYPYVRNTLEDGTPCSFYIHESITNIVQGSGFFNHLTEAEVYADGYISNCPGENMNSFDISGTLCVN